MSVELKASVVEDDMCVMPLKDEEFCWQIPHENYPLALELTEYITATDKYFISELDPFNPGESLVRDVMHLFDSGKVIPREFVAQLLKKSIAQHGKIPNVVPVSRSRFESESSFSTELPYSGSVTVVGDLHGQYGDFANLFTNPAFGGLPSTYNRFVINGDMVDRGLYSVEIMVLALLIKLFFPDDMHLLRGNHESAGMNASHGFYKEILSKYPESSNSLCTLFAQLFNALPVAAVIEGQIFVTHGGLGAQVSKLTIAEINALNRFQEPWHCAPLTELMWSGKKLFNVLLYNTDFLLIDLLYLFDLI